MGHTQSTKKARRCPTKARAPADEPTKPDSVYSPAVEELVAIGAAIACNCERCFKYHYLQARKEGVTHEDIAQAVAIAQKVKDSPARAILELAQRHLHGAAIPTEKSTAPDACSRAELNEPDEVASPCCSTSEQ